MTTKDDSNYDFRYHSGLLSSIDSEAVKSKHGYELFVGAHPELEDLTYKQWVDLIDAMRDKGDKPALKFVSPSPLGGLGTAAATALAGKVLNINPGATVDDILAAGKEFLKSEALRQIEGLSFPPFGGGGVGIEVDGDGGDGGTTQDGYAGGSNFNPTGLSLNYRPVDTRFVTDIVPLYRPKFFLDGVGSNAPLIIKFRNVFPEYDEATSPSFWGGNTDIQRYLQNKVISNWVNVMSTRVKLNSFSSPLINFKHIMNYYRVISYSLAVLYFYRSIDAHFRLDGNRNDAMIALYKSLSANDIRQVTILAQILDEIPLPPLVNEFMFHFYDNYKQSHLPGSPLLKFSPVVFDNVDDNNFSSINTGQVDFCIKMLQTKPFRDFQQVLVQAFPDLVKTKTLSYSGLPKYDANWLTCWVNQVFTDVGGSMKPTVGDQSTAVTHNLITDAPDGWIDAANNIKNSTTGNMEGGFGGPKIMGFTASEQEYPVTSTHFSTYTDLGTQHSTDSYIYATDINKSGQTVQSFFPLEYRERYQILSGNTFKQVLGVSGVKTFQRSGAELAIPRTIRDNVDICNQFADLLYGPMSLVKSSSSSKMDFKAEVEETEAKPKRRRRKRKKK